MPSREDRVVGRTASWDPKYPEAAMSAEQGVYDETMSGGAPYESAPDTSHIYGWKLLKGGFVSKFYGPSIGAPSDTKAIVGVAFKPSPPKGSPKGTAHPNQISSEYVYAFPTEAAAEGYMDAFRAAAHPGHVVQELIDARVWYKRVAQA